MKKVKAVSTSEYIQTAPKIAQKHLQDLRTILKKVVPQATEAIKWGSPVFETNRILFAYSANKSHLNFMPTRTTLAAFKKELEKYNTGKDTIKFPYDKPLPTSLIQKIARYRFREVSEGSLWMHKTTKIK